MIKLTRLPRFRPQLLARTKEASNQLKRHIKRNTRRNQMSKLTVKNINTSKMRVSSRKIVLMSSIWKLVKMLLEAMKKWWWKNRQKPSDHLLSRNQALLTVAISMRVCQVWGNPAPSKTSDTSTTAPAIPSLTLKKQQKMQLYKGSSWLAITANSRQNDCSCSALDLMATLHNRPRRCQLTSCLWQRSFKHSNALWAPKLWELPANRPSSRAWFSVPWQPSPSYHVIKWVLSLCWRQSLLNRLGQRRQPPKIRKHKAKKRLGKLWRRKRKRIPSPDSNLSSKSGANKSSLNVGATRAGSSNSTGSISGERWLMFKMKNNKCKFYSFVLIFDFSKKGCI